MKLPVTLTSMLLCAASCLAQPYHRPAGYYAPAPIGHDGRVVDTPEVAQAKAAHLAAFSQLAVQPSHYHAAATAPAAYGGHYSNPSYFSSRVQHAPAHYRGPPAPLAHDGRVIDTPEVAQAKAAHFAAINHAASHYGPAPGAYRHSGNEDYNDHDSGAYNAANDDDGSNEGHYNDGHYNEGHYNEGRASAPYHGPPAPLAQDGRVIDTPEVAQAKAAHLAAFHRASHGHHHAAPPPPPRPYYGDY